MVNCNRILLVGIIYLCFHFRTFSILFYTCHHCTQWRRNRNIIGGAGARGCKAVDYLREVSACEGQELGGLKTPSSPGSAALDCTFVARQPNINFFLTATVCTQRNIRTWPTGILGSVQYSYKMEAVSFILNSINLIVALCIIFSSCFSSCLQLGSPSSLMDFTLTLSVRYT